MGTTSSMQSYAICPFLNSYALFGVTHIAWSSHLHSAQTCDCSPELFSRIRAENLLNMIFINKYTLFDYLLPSKKNSLFEFYFFTHFLHHWKNENDLFSIKFHSSELNVLFLLNIIPFMLALKRYVSCKILLTKYNCFTKIVF